MNKKAIISILTVASSLIAAPSFAENKVCVHLPVGVGYAASFEVEALNSDVKTQESGRFAVGETRCLDVSKIADHSEYKVILHPFWGKTIDCTPHLIKEPTPADVQSHITFKATGTTLAPRCKMYGV
jgi:hypothetical protein